MHRSRILRSGLSAALIAVLTACGGGGGGGGSIYGGAQPPPPIQPPPPPPVLASYVALNLVTGQLQTQPATWDPTTAPATTMVFRALPGGSVSIGGTPVAVSAVAIGIHELTQAQWMAIANTQPWTAVTPTAAVGSTTTDGAAPAFGLSRDVIVAALAALHATNNNTGPNLRLPTEAEWEYACRAGSTGTWSWGNNETSAAANAVVQETAGGVLGVRRVGSLAPNAYGLFDMHGNVWEWTAGPAAALAALRGGSWSDDLLAAGASARQQIDPDVPYGTAGARLVLVR